MAFFTLFLIAAARTCWSGIGGEGLYVPYLFAIYFLQKASPNKNPSS